MADVCVVGCKEYPVYQFSVLSDQGSVPAWPSTGSERQQLRVCAIERQLLVENFEQGPQTVRIVVVAAREWCLPLEFVISNGADDANVLRMYITNELYQRLFHSRNVRV